MSVDHFIARIARTLSEDSNPLDDYTDKWEAKTVLSDDTYYQVIGILKRVVEENGCVLDHRKLTVEFIPPGFIIKNVWIDCPDPGTKKGLIDNLAQSTGDETIKHTFDDNMRVNLYNAINRTFGDRVREELNLDVTHQFRALPPGSDTIERNEVLPMITITTPKVSTEGDEEAFGEVGEDDMPLPLGEPEAGPEEPMGGPFEAPEGGAEPEGTPIQLPGFEDEGGAPDEGGPEMDLPPRRSDEEEMLSFESIQRIAEDVDFWL